MEFKICRTLELVAFFIIQLWAIGTATPEKCHTEMHSYNGSIKSLRDTDAATNKQSCSWVITTLHSYRLKLTFEILEIEKYADCEYGHIIVYDGPSTLSKSLGKFCGQNIPLPVFSSQNVMRLDYVSDPNDRGLGFKAAYETVIYGTSIQQREGSFESPTFSDSQLSYRRCAWTIETSSELQVSVNVHSIQFSSYSDGSKEYLEIYSIIDVENKNSSSTYLSPSRSVLLERICNNRATTNNGPPYKNLRSASNKMYILYVSEQRDQGLHFTIDYNSVSPGGYYNQDRAMITSINYPGNYTENCNHIWNIEVSVGYLVALEFRILQIAHSSHCAGDYLEVRDGLKASDPLLTKRLCGAAMPGLLQSSSNKMQLHFVSDAGDNAKGFLAHYTKKDITPTSEGPYCDPRCRNRASYNGGACLLSSSADKMWFDVKSHTEKNNTEVSVHFGRDIDECATLNGKCQQKCENTLGSYRCSCDPGFVLQYDLHHCEKANCGGDLNSDDGALTLTSPSIPAKHSRRMDCVWKITVPEGNNVTLEFSKFRLARSPNCSAVYLEIRDGLNDSSPLIVDRVYNNTMPVPVYSSSNHMYLRYRSNDFTDETKFMADFGKDINECEIKNGGCEYWCQNTLGSYVCLCPEGKRQTGDKRGCADACFFNYGVTTTDQYFMSPNFPKNYPDGTLCGYYLNTLPGHRIFFRIHDFNLERPWDSLTVYDGEDRNAPMFGSFSGHHSFQPFVTAENYLYAVFQSDGSKNYRGFQVQHKTVCGGDLTATLDQKHIYSHPLFGKEAYPDHQQCLWNINSTNGSPIYLRFLSFELQDHHNCDADYIEVYNDRRNLTIDLARYCGSKIPGMFVSSNGTMRMKFRSDGGSRHPGFQASYSIAEF